MEFVLARTEGGIFNGDAAHEEARSPNESGEQTARDQYWCAVEGFPVRLSSDWLQPRPMASLPTWRLVRISQWEHALPARPIGMQAALGQSDFAARAAANGAAGNTARGSTACCSLRGRREAAPVDEREYKCQ